MEKLYAPDFLIIPYPLIADEEITPIDEKLYGIIYWFTKMKLEKCTASNEVLSKFVKSSTSSIANSLTRLEKRGYIKRKFKDEKKKIRTEIIPLIVFSKVSLEKDTSKKVSSEKETVYSEKDTRVYFSEEQNSNMLNKKSKTVKANDSAILFFELFWSKYPIKKSKKPALQKWLIIDPSLYQKIIEDVDNRKKDRSWIEGYIPLATTYLNQERWEDEITPPMSNLKHLSAGNIAPEGEYDDFIKKQSSKPAIN